MQALYFQVILSNAELIVCTNSANMKCFTLEMTEQSFEAHLNVNCAWCQCDKMIWLEASR